MLCFQAIFAQALEMLEKVRPTIENDELLTGFTNKFNLEYICVHT